MGISRPQWRAAFRRLNHLVIDSNPTKRPHFLRANWRTNPAFPATTGTFGIYMGTLQIVSISRTSALRRILEVSTNEVGREGGKISFEYILKVH